MSGAVHDVIVLGAGAAGLLCAVTAGERGFRCALLEHGPRAGRKLCIAGGGRGNVTNRDISPSHYVGEQPPFVNGPLKRCSTGFVLEMLRSFGIPWEEREHGRIFCTIPAARLVDALLERALGLGSGFFPNHSVEQVEHSGGMFHVSTSRGVFHAPRLVIATGGPSWPGVGASDAGMRLARHFGHRVVPPRPVLAPFILPRSWPLHGLSGISLPARVNIQDSPHKAETDALLFTHRGLSGPVALQASCFWQSGQPLTVDFLPEKPLSKVLADPAGGKATPAGLLGRLLPSRLADRLLETFPVDAACTRIARLSRAERRNLCALVHAHTVTPTRTEGMNKAEATAGGIDTRDIHPRRLESRLVPGLHFAGEVLDITGMLGGYNLHWAWASGKAVGEAFRR